MEMFHFCDKKLICKMLSLTFCKEMASLCQIEAQVSETIKQSLIFVSLPQIIILHPVPRKQDGLTKISRKKSSRSSPWVN